jgi:IEC3 subunit of the Ino80 complex, chromatin re-modelling
MVRFEDRMKESNTLYKEHQRILDVSRRLSEQNEYVATTSFSNPTYTHLHQVNYSSFSTISTKLPRYHHLIVTIFNLPQMLKGNLHMTNQISLTPMRALLPWRYMMLVKP